MINIRNFRDETDRTLRFKGYVRNIREKQLFYLEHSKLACYADSEYLNVFLEELLDYSNSWTRLGQKNMNPEKNPASEGHANARIYHSIDVSENGRAVSRQLLLNELLARVGGLVHDLTHTAFAHEGEHIISNYLYEQGICKIYHGALVPIAFTLENTHENVLKRLEQMQGKPLSEKQLQRYYSTFLNICDIAVCHNGESTNKTAEVNRKKTDADIETEWIDVLTLSKTDKQVVNRTKEGAVIAFCDLISYVGKDFKDGVIKHLIDVNDPQYEALFIRLGLSKNQLDEWALGKYDKKTEIVRWITRRLRDDLVANSKLVDCAQMSDDLRDSMYALRKLNYDRVIIPGQRKINPILRANVGPLIDLYAQYFIENPNLEGVDFSTPAGHYLEHTITNIKNQSPNVIRKYEQIVSKGIRNTINADINMFLGNAPEKQKPTKRYNRIAEDLAELQKISPITQEVKEKYITKLMQEINLSPQESKQLFEKKIKAKFPDAKPEDMPALLEKYSYQRIETFTECMAKLRLAIYLGESTNDFLLDVMESQGLLSTEERKLRYISGGSLEGSSIMATMESQKEHSI